MSVLTETPVYIVIITTDITRNAGSRTGRTGPATRQRTAEEVRVHHTIMIGKA